VTDASDQVTSSLHDLGGREVLSKGSGNVTTRQFDALGRITRERMELANPADQTWVYDGLKSIYTDRNGRMIVSESVPTSRTQKEQWFAPGANVSSDPSLRQIEAVSNIAGDLEIVDDTDPDAGSTIDYTYDKLGRADLIEQQSDFAGGTAPVAVLDSSYLKTGIRNQLALNLDGTTRLQQNFGVDNSPLESIFSRPKRVRCQATPNRIKPN
jgi:hypothetical protein